ncbi:uncharacterized protein DUF397 [Streptomyces sp. 3212.3]|uniref:DUF397 domain-containing protein n=1 Tax=Streptomyces sp. 3212.3 TaxID=1938846 RepID=UPI000E279567|nr:DUF397 domain-containing protein [Streptomyces sp. 3212.3]REE62109.1 uncharacterized protein DUF397 [Streptomyces sp. 3212.3]
MHNTEGLTFVKSSFSGGNGACVGVAELPDGGRALRHTKKPGDGTQFYTREEWDAFIAGAKAGEFDN